jgi:hypothetical protein
VRPTETAVESMNSSDQLRAQLGSMPSMSEEGDDSEAACRSWANFSVAGLLLVQTFAAIVISLTQIATALVVVLAMLLAFVMLHYLIWGRWLGEVIGQEVEDEELEADLRASQRFG